MSRAEARAKLAADAPAAWSAPIPVQVGDRETTVSPPPPA
ncbi:hypothetical protein SNARM312S_07422 [Streptomyces narbonensis]